MVKAKQVRKARRPDPAWAARLRKERERWGHTQEDAASLIGVNRRMYQWYEAGTYVPAEPLKKIYLRMLDRRNDYA
jgi:DNA-binding XRE family transcriptional regulator